MDKPVLAVLAAGMGSRYGGLKQMDAVGPCGEVIIDYSIYDAKKAGFEKVIFIIKKSIEEDFRRLVGSRLEKNIEVAYAFQELDDLPKGYAVPAGRTKPWGTTHAVLSASRLADGPFAVINADDYYGPQAFKALYDFLRVERPADGKQHYAMVGYRVENTVTEHGSVARGVCEANAQGMLTGIAERTQVEKTADGARYSADGGRSWVRLPAGTPVSMNFWGFEKGFFELARESFPRFLDENLPKNPEKCEALLPNFVGELIAAGKADVRVLASGDVWYGVTYKEDKPGVVDAITGMYREGRYPQPLWG